MIDTLKGESVLPGAGVTNKLMAKAQEMGAHKVIGIQTKQIVVEDRVVLKCRYGCPSYGRNLVCPPHTPSPGEFRQILQEYRTALVLIFEPRMGETWDELNHRAYESTLELEKMAMALNLPFALALRSSRCTLCQECPQDGNCLSPERKRFSPGSVGINVIQTLQRCGVALDFSQPNQFQAISLLLVR